MKRLIAGLTTLLLALLMLSAPVLAGTEPCVIALAIKTVPPEAAVGLTIILKQGGVPIAQGSVNSYKEIVFEVSQIWGVQCTSFEAIILGCEDNIACHKTVGFNPSGYTTWDITAVDVPCPVCPEDTTPYAECNSCCPIITTTTIPTEETCEEQGYILPEECPTAATFETVIQFIIAIVFSAGAGYGIKVYMSRTGEVKMLHKHIGIRGYHDPNIIHRNPLYRHKKGEIAPKLPK